MTLRYPTVSQLHDKMKYQDLTKSVEEYEINTRHPEPAGQYLRSALDASRAATQKLKTQGQDLSERTAPVAIDDIQEVRSHSVENGKSYENLETRPPKKALESSLTQDARGAELRLGRAGIALYQDIEVAKDTGIIDKLGFAAKERARQSSLDLMVPIDVRLNAIYQSLGNIRLLGES
ncbi:hypothetical protein PsorP6_001689 [Peronosclerospora sorghi]|uniref:Uncharacterized protein n=1 Tax=Peronosclerospora sorghi TaxID=230839 RepID=A0ACC0WU09_9STRA|nr:hypothetical protein PsorP6_001689 [Peronosclerospora sorghi]